MKIGIFDSGLGGLIVTRRIVELLPQYDYVYLGDAERLPYGTRSPEVVFKFTKSAVEFLFRKGCKLVIVACNTASALALRRIQREFLPRRFPNHKVLGVVAPTLEAVDDERHKIKNLGIIGTTGTINSKVYVRELRKRHKELAVFQQATPLLVPMIESRELKYLTPILKDYLQSLLRRRINGLILGCTHYPLIKAQIKKVAGSNVRVFSQDEIIPVKLRDYLHRHPEIEKGLSRGRERTFFVTDITPAYRHLARLWFGKSTPLKLAHLQQ